MSEGFVVGVVIVTTAIVLIAILGICLKSSFMKSLNSFDKFIYLLIMANVLAMILDSHQSIHEAYGNLFYQFEFVSIIIFSFEYLFRVFLAYKQGKFQGAFNYIFSFWLN